MLSEEVRTCILDKLCMEPSLLSYLRLATGAASNNEARGAREDGHDVGHDGPHDREAQVEHRDAADELALAALAEQSLGVFLLLGQQEEEDPRKRSHSVHNDDGSGQLDSHESRDDPADAVRELHGDRRAKPEPLVAEDVPDHDHRHSAVHDDHHRAGYDDHPAPVPVQPPLGRDHDAEHEQQVAQDVTQGTVDRSDADHVILNGGAAGVRDVSENVGEEVVRDNLVDRPSAQQVPEAADVLFEVGSLDLLFLDEEPRHGEHGDRENGHDDHELREAQREAEVAAVVLAVEEEARKQLADDHHHGTHSVDARLRLATLVQRFALGQLARDTIGAHVRHDVPKRCEEHEHHVLGAFRRSVVVDAGLDFRRIVVDVDVSVSRISEVRFANGHNAHDQQHDEANGPADQHVRPTTVAADRQAVGQNAVKHLEAPRQHDELSRSGDLRARAVEVLLHEGVDGLRQQSVHKADRGVLEQQTEVLLAGQHGHAAFTDGAAFSSRRTGADGDLVGGLDSGIAALLQVLGLRGAAHER
ncbi:hypothetical protein ON010_g5093 [Phytophthora cinnamomi]|nr:hypothetical protein ON010_g5093 [Phytophthora cinnamomi]